MRTEPTEPSHGKQCETPMITFGSNSIASSSERWDWGVAEELRYLCVMLMPYERFGPPKVEHTRAINLRRKIILFIRL
jgi:hypothetical protein